MRILVAIWRFISMYELRQSLKINKAADQVFTKDAEGVGLAFDQHQKNLVADYNELQGAVAQVVTVLEQKRERMETVEGELREAEQALEGALAQYADAEAKGDEDAMREAEQWGTDFNADVDRLTALEEELEGDIADQEAQVEKLMRRLEVMQRDIAALDTEKAEAIADFVSDRALKEANEKLAGIRTNTDSSAIDAVRENRRKMRAEAKVSGKLAGVDAKERREKFLKKGKDAAAQSKFAQMAAARKAEKEDATGAGKDAKKERPDISG